MLENKNCNSLRLDNITNQMEVQSTQVVVVNPEIMSNLKQESCNLDLVQKQANNLISKMLKASGDNLIDCLKKMIALVKDGHAQLFVKNMTLMKKLMNEFQAAFKSIQDQNSKDNAEFMTMYLLSVFAELMRDNPILSLPLTRKFIMSVLRIDYQLLQLAPRKNDILAILGVIYENFSRNLKIKTPSILEGIKKSLLENYYLIQELFTLKVFNKALYNLSARGINLSIGEFHKYRVLSIVGSFFSSNQLETFINKLNGRLNTKNVESKNEKHASRSN